MLGWSRISIRKLAWFCEQAPDGMRWRLEKKPAAKALQVVTKHGLLDLKLAGGCWVRKQNNTLKK